ncbi:MAG: LysR family transcriptional regulator [Rhizobiaceae bacterium]|nr:LysR family transcriptional regulator [Rhizobiaceae bacterium]
MDLRQLQYFLTTLENRSFGRAAEILHVSQPALSKAVKRLEDDLGVKLLERLPRGVAPTLFGDALAAHANLISGEINRAKDAIASLKDGNSGRVIVGAGSSMRIELMPEAAMRLLRRHPDVTLELVGELYDDLIPDLQNGLLDLALSMIPTTNTNPDIVCEALYVDKTHPTVRVGHSLLEISSLTIEDCQAYDWILPKSENLGRRHLDAFYLKRNLLAPIPVIETNSTVFAIQALRRSDLIGWHPTRVIGNSDETGLAALPIEEITLTRTVGITTRRDSVLSPAALLLIEELKQVSAEMINAGTVMPLPSN